MRGEIDETHSPELRSWVESANSPSTDFPIQNLPFGIFRRRGSPTGRVGVAIGDQIVDVVAAAANVAELAQMAGVATRLCESTTLNALMKEGNEPARRIRHALSALLRVGSRANESASGWLVPQADVAMALPADIGDYTDFYASVFHATNVGSMFRPDNPLLPNYKYVPIGYHGRASSVVVSGTAVRRPVGQTRDDPAASAPSFGPSRRLDYELEVGAFVARGNELGQPFAVDEAESRIFGLCLLNDWSARDIQAWEYQPLGPFLAKSFATSISPWVVTVDALAPFRTPSFRRPVDDPEPLPYLRSERTDAGGGFDIALEVFLSTKTMRDQRLAPLRLSTSNLSTTYWTLAQLVTHHASNGCNLRPGDLIGSGTVSGSSKDSRGCLLELTWKGTEPILLPTGETRRFLEDGDEVVLRGSANREGFRRIGFGECRGRVEPASALTSRV